jgi:hypothetical protein
MTYMDAIYISHFSEVSFSFLLSIVKKMARWIFRLRPEDKYFRVKVIFNKCEVINYLDIFLYFRVQCMYV